MSSEFPLFRLPALAYIHVIKLMTPTEKVTFSFCSRNTHYLVRHPRNKLSKSKIFLRCDDYPDYWDETSQEDEAFHPLILANEKREQPKDLTTSIDIRGHRVPCRMTKDEDGRTYLETYWEDQAIGRFAIIDYVRELFQCNLYGICLYSEHRSQFFPIYRRQTFIDRIYIRDEERWRIKPEHLKYILKNAETDLLCINVHVKDGFQVEGYRRKLEVLIVKKAHWVTMDNLKTIDSKEILILGKFLSNEELNQFLMHWIQGGSDRLKFFSINMKEYDEDEALAGIKVVKRHSGRRVYTTTFGEKVTIEGTEIRRNDGIKATVQYSRYYNTFELAIFPEALGSS